LCGIDQRSAVNMKFGVRRKVKVRSEDLLELQSLAKSASALNILEIYGQPHCQDACASIRLIMPSLFYPSIQAMPSSPAKRSAIAFGFLPRVPQLTVVPVRASFKRRQCARPIAVVNVKLRAAKQASIFARASIPARSSHR
jgi:hypothetical protein